MKGYKLNKRAIMLVCLVFGLSTIQNAAFSNETAVQTENTQNVKVDVSTTQQVQMPVAEVKPKVQKAVVVSKPRLPQVTYKSLDCKYAGKVEKVYPVYISNKEVFRFKGDLGTFTAEQRAKILTYRIKQFIAKGGNPKLIMPAKEGSVIVIRAGKDTLFTLNNEEAKAMGLSLPEYALNVTNTFRAAFRAPSIVRDGNLLASRGFVTPSFARDYLWKAESGVASWYGGVFHGRKAADGSIYNKYKFTAAHKTLPFGSIVRVTNVNNGRSCLVRITDRGPFVPGRVIDLSTAAAREIGIIDTGISKVKLEIVDRI